MNGRLFNITNDNPEDILIVNIEHAEITINLEYITFINKNEENLGKLNKVLSKPNDKNELNFSIPGNSIVSFSFQVNSAKDKEMTSIIKFNFENVKNIFINRKSPSN